MILTAFAAFDEEVVHLIVTMTMTIIKLYNTNVINKVKEYLDSVSTWGEADNFAYFLVLLE